MIGVCWRFSVVFLDFRLLSNLDIVNFGIYLALLYFGHCQYSNINVACSRMWNKISRCWKYSMSTTSDLFTRSTSSDALKLTFTALRSASFGLQGAPPVRQQLGGRLPPFSSTNLEPTKSWWLDKPQHCSWEREESSAGTRFNPQALSLRVEPFKPNYSVVRACEEKMSAKMSLCFVVRLYSEQICIHCVAFTRSGNRKVFNHWKPQVTITRSLGHRVTLSFTKKLNEWIREDRCCTQFTVLWMLQLDLICCFCYSFTEGQR